MEVLDLSGGVKVEPLVSIITPSYNSEKYLDAFFISILEQDYENYVMSLKDEKPMKAVVPEKKDD